MQNSQHNKEEKELSWRADPTQLQNKLQGYNNQDSVVLVKEQAG